MKLPNLIKPITIAKKNIFGLVLIMVIAAILRFTQLGYSDFYGDETKVLYLDKTVPAFSFFMDQRKGPVQFFVVWVVEKLVGDYSQFWIRFPFAVAGLLSIAALYFLTKRLFNSRIAFYAAFLYSISGFSIAFSRTAQYQSFVVLFGLLSIYLFLLSLQKKSKKLLVLSSLSFALSMYSHYDGIIYFIPILYWFYQYANHKDFSKKTVFFTFIVPMLAVLSIFYVPYILKGFFEDNTVGYLYRRFSGSTEFSVNHSLYTYFVYNPYILAFIPLVMFLLTFFKKSQEPLKMLLAWVIVPLVFFELIVLNPGTHIQHYFLPLFIICGFMLFEIERFVSNTKVHATKLVFNVLVISLFAYLTLGSFYVFIPSLNSGYPWKDFSNGLFSFSKPTKQYHLFLYGFPYNRGWNIIREYMLSLDGVRGVYTNDNDTVAQYYLREFNYTQPGTNFIPQYYIYVFDEQEFGKKNLEFEQMISLYSESKRIYFEGNLTSIIYKRR